MDGWYEKLRDRLPDGPILPHLIDAVERLPGVCDWCPEGGLENRWMQIVRWGFVLWMTRLLTGLDALQRQMAADILESGAPKPDLLAELSGAGLCVALGAVPGERLPRRDTRSADWRLTWPGGFHVEVEVTTARLKEAHAQREALARELAEAIFSAERGFDAVVHLADPTSQGDRKAVVAAAQSMKDKGVNEVPGKWQVRCEPIIRAPTVFLSGMLDPRPTWWSPTHARCFVARGMAAGPDTHRAPPQVGVYYGVPYYSYINPVMRKADVPQGTTGLPFLVVVDVANLPGAFREIPDAVQGYLPFWKSVSGILLYHDLFRVESVGWEWRLVSKPFATAPLPDALLKVYADLLDRMETGVRLTTIAEERKGSA